jgi:hypothetical protein
MENKKDEFIIGGNLYKSNEDFSLVMGLTFISVGFLPLLYGVLWLAIVFWLIGILCMWMAFHKIPEVKKKED